MPVPSTVGDADRRWADAVRELAAVPPLSRARRVAANVVLAIWGLEVVVMLIALATPLFGMTGTDSRSGWQVLGAVGLLLLATVGLLRGVRSLTSTTLRQVAPTGAERRAVRRQLAGRVTVPARSRPVLDAIVAEELALSLLVLAAIATYLLGYLDGVAANGWAGSATLGLPLLVTVFVLLAVLPAVRVIGALRYSRVRPGANA